MSLIETVHGTLKSDGTLDLDQAPNLSPGRVKVILESTQAGTIPKRGLTAVIDEIRRDQQARGYPGRTIAEMAADDAARNADEDEYEQRMANLLGQPRGNP